MKMSIAMQIVRVSFALFLVTVAMASSCSCRKHSVLQDGREMIELGDTDEVIWAVQISDLHISPYHVDRSISLQKLMGPLLNFINPSLVLITGDLTDAKSKDRLSRRQDEAEWVEYRQTMHKVMEESRLPSYVFYDLRGNHDKFGVPKAGSSLDFFSKYSISSLRNRTNAIQSVTLTNGGWKHLFLGVDTSMDVGLRGPCHLFGHPTDELLTKIDSELSQWDSHSAQKVTKVVFGHYPMSFTASTPKKERLELLLVKHSISAYICGHLHTIFGRNIVKHHVYPDSKLTSRDGEFWEWEMGDWRTSRMMRVIAIDQGHTSYSDFDISNLNGSHEDSKTWLPTLVIPTYPLDSRTMNHLRPPSSSLTLNSIRALVLSNQPLISVTARMFDTLNGEMLLLEEMNMHILSKAGESAYMYVSEWNGGKYIDPSGTRYAYQISVVDASGIYTNSSLRPFSINQRFGELKKTWKEFIVMDIVFEHAYIFLLRLAFTILFVFFIFPKAIFHFLEKNGNYNRWVSSLFQGQLTARKAIGLFIWFFVQGCANNAVWCVQLMAIVWMIFFPWFWGEVLPDGHPIGSMSIWGWTIHLDGQFTPQSGLGWPDLMVVVLPYLFFVILPLYTVIFALSAEAAVRKFYQRDAREYKKREKDGNVDDDERKNLMIVDDDLGGERHSAIGGLIKVQLENNQKSTSGNWIHVLLLAFCALIALIHFRQVRALVGAHGALIVLASPGFAWLVPVLMITSILQYSIYRKEA